MLTLAANQDYASFYEQEISFRRLNLYPPFCAICMVGFSGGDEAAVLRAARAFAALCKAKHSAAAACRCAFWAPRP